VVVHTLHPDATIVIGGPTPEGFVARFVDEVNGDDDNDGTSAATAFATIAAATAEELTSDTYLLLATGSRFREELTGLTPGVHVRAYGYGERPIIDGRDIALNASFSKTSGRTNVYEIAWTHDFGADGGKSAHRVWEAGAMLARAASLAACDSTAGSFYAGAPTTGGPDTIYIHPAGSTNPVTNGIEYAITKRRWCVQLFDSYNQAHVTGLETIGNSYADGSLCIDGYVEDCVARDGRIHNAFILGEAVDCQALGTEYGDFAMFVSYVDSGPTFGGPTNRNVLYNGCVADAQQTSDLGSGFYAHTDFVRSFGTIEYRDCRTVGCDAGWGGTGANTFVNYRCTYDDVRNAYTQVANVSCYYLGGTGIVRAGNFSGGLANIVAAVSGLALVFHGCKVWALGNFATAYLENPNGTISAERCTIWAPNANGSFWFRRGLVTYRRNLVQGVGIGTPAHQLDGLETDYNCNYQFAFGTGTYNAQFPGTTTYVGLVQWIPYLNSEALGTDRDAHSIEQEPALVDPANLDFTIGNATVLALGAGAEVDEEDDTELQAYWLANRVTEV
jgi:hypothetical protein